ncbi:MAG: class I SAM-dependent methyltransferase [Oscillibacter sp.]|nr:class I SAM-dependent methyltransferase [Oscillibacter sp.]
MDDNFLNTIWDSRSYLEYWNDYHRTQKGTSVPIESILDQCVPYLSETARTLEVGCGSGQLLPPLSRRFPNLYACDVSETAITRIDPQIPVKLCVNDPCELPYESSSMDFIVISQVLSTITEQTVLASLISEIRRVLAACGHLLIIDYCYSLEKQYQRKPFGEMDVNVLSPKWSKVSFVHYTPEQFLSLFSPCREVTAGPAPLTSCMGNCDSGCFVLMEVM